jgi:hypothetical protein
MIVWTPESEKAIRDEEHARYRKHVESTPLCLCLHHEAEHGDEQLPHTGGILSYCGCPKFRKMPSRLFQALREYRAWQAIAFLEPRTCPTCLQISGAHHLTPCPDGRGPVPCRRYMHTPSPDGLCECGASIAEHSRELYVRKETP